MWLIILKKEIQLFGRAKNGFLSLVSLVFSFLFLFNYAFEDSSNLEPPSLIGLRWAIIFLLSYVLIGQSVWEEREGGAQKIARNFVPPYLLYLGKSIFLFIVLFFVEIGLFFAFGVFFKNQIIEKKAFLQSITYLGPGSLCLCLLGVSLSSLSQSTRLKEILLPVLQTPLTIPIFLFGIEAERNFTRTGIFDGKVFILLGCFCLLYGSIGAFILELDSE